MVFEGIAEVVLAEASVLAVTEAEGVVEEIGIGVETIDLAVVEADAWSFFRRSVPTAEKSVKSLSALPEKSRCIAAIALPSSLLSRDAIRMARMDRDRISREMRRLSSSRNFSQLRHDLRTTPLSKALGSSLIH